MKSYNYKNIESKWQKIWEDKELFKAVDFSDKPKFYGLVEFPYPSGIGLHVGHVRAYTSLEVISRKRRLEGYNVLFPIGWDAFGLPTENYAIQTGRHPRLVTDENIKVFTEQLKEIGYSFDWDRTVDTTDENYYKWTQWIFLKLFEKGLAYKNKTYVNFCNDCKVVLANEESQDGKCDRCGSEVVQMEKDVWFLKIREYSEKLLEGLEKVDFLPRIKLEQENWIGKSSGAEVDFQIDGTDDKLSVFTTRPDTLYGVTFMVVAPEHPLIEKYSEKISNMDQIKEYQEQAKKKTEFERVQLAKDKSGVEVKGVKVRNPLNGELVPLWVADYVMMGYGTGAIMAVPGHDGRDWEFAKKFDIPIIEVIQGGNVLEEAFTDIENGILVNSDIINGMNVKEAKEKIISHLESHGVGKRTVNYKMKDWAFNRQRYWGEPIPVVHCETCGIVGVPENELPVKLPQVKNYKPTDTGESPLASIEEWVNTTCPKCGQKAKRETDTMPQWAGSSWYFLRYIDPRNNEEFASQDKLKYWLQIDWYNGGMEHVSRHLIYSRFWHRFLYDIGEVPVDEPYAKRTAQGLILGADGEKMSKSRGNVINPREIIGEYGADTLRTYIMFIGDYEKPAPWSDNGVKGCRRFLDRVWKLENILVDGNEYSKDNEVMMNKTIKKVTEDYENLKFNTAIAALMTLINEFNAKGKINKKEFSDFLLLLNPVAPHITEELWEVCGIGGVLHEQGWPGFDPEKTVEDVIEMAVQVNGKVRGKIQIPVKSTQAEANAAAMTEESIKAHIEGKTIVKEIFVPGRIYNIVVK
ncbi:leucine--tRNA ligase [Alkalibacter saccharofermentans]|uniref:Leucine--tRNA ligase n=1 Tax=Alkalibacter saccharofermentans DSM 14828 TaxID=1120975 RepID=A0A1M4V1S2_9FIRM|nr:leucine--tRNA ligase [Alkalibacter saccharofermentans]SHE62850.1 leucyl-tRNA synthetase [Alkalibacter saccharofermentans DSM 14828]